MQILVNTIKLDENKALAKLVIPRNFKTLNEEKLSKYSCSAPCFRSGKVHCGKKKGRQGEKAVVIKKFYTPFSNEITKVFAKETR